MSLKYVLGCSAAIGAVVLSGTAVAQDRTFNIPSQDITSAISVFGRQSGLQIVAPASRLQGVQSRPVVGRMDARAALRQLIAGSNLEVASDSGGVIVLRLPAPTTGSAQTDQSVVLDEVVVTGSRYQGREEVRRKAAATTVVDTLSQDDTGDLPDQSMAEALRRIPGIATLYDEDEGQFVTIRGIQPSLNYTTLDGLGLAAVAGNGNGARRVDLSLIPSQSARRAEAYKTFTADMDAGVVGGLINIVPRSAYDQRRNTFGVLDVYANYFTYGDVPGVNSLGGEKDSPWGGGFNGIWSRRFGQNDQFGLVLSANFQQKQRDTVKPGVATWGFYTDAGATTTPDEDDWNGVAAPSQFQIHAYTNRIRNGGGSARFEWKPSDRWYNSLLLFGYTQGEQETRNSNALQSLDQPQGLTAEGGDFRTRAARVFYTQQLFDRSSRGAQYHSTFRPDDVSTLDFNFGYSTATFENHSPLITYQANPATRLQYVGTGEFPTFTLTDTATYLNPAAYKLTDAQWSDKAARAEQSEVKLDYARNVGPDSLGFGWQAGVDFRRYHLWRDFDYTLYNTDNSTLAALAIDPQYTPDGWPYPVLWMDNDAFWADVAPGLAVNARASARDSHLEDYKYWEDTAAAYISATYATDRLRVIAGLRYDQVDFHAYTPQAINGDPAGFTTADGGYDSWLPSLNMRYELAPSLRLKASFSQTLGRPDPNTLARAETRNDVDMIISRGNPDIRPRRADNYDLTIERFFGGDSAVSLGVFDKEIQDEIFVLGDQQMIDGDIYTVRQPLNAEASRLTGVEFSYVQNRIPLPGPLEDNLGIFFNATRTWGEMNYRIGDQTISLDWMPMQGEWAANAAVFYALPRDGEIRLAANYQSAYTDTVGADPWQNEGWQDFFSLDLTIRHQLTDHLIAKFQARNLTDADRIGLLGGDLEYHRTQLEFGRSFYLNLVYKL